MRALARMTGISSVKVTAFEIGCVHMQIVNPPVWAIRGGDSFYE